MVAYRPRRSVLYLPASNARALAKARTLACDAVILDLEDAVAPDAKVAAREAAVDAVRTGGFGRRELAVRVNAVGTQWHDADLAAVCAAGPDAVVVPKVDSAETVRALAAALETYGAPQHTSLWAMVETPTAVLHAAEIGAASDRLTVLVMGTNDLVKELGVEHVPGRLPLQTSLGLTVLGAKAAGVVVLDGVYNDLSDDDGYLDECRQGRALGFDGKTLIHPRQVEGANAAYAPSDEAVEDARGLLEAWREAQGAGVVTYRGRMVENLHVATAERVLALHEAISALDD
ncbi:MAG TPA: CoA ester lyase [Propionibacteriaceae bacterium]|nr:CoA ester lyase [Propionibacteriaceae bacterium]